MKSQGEVSSRRVMVGDVVPRILFQPCNIRHESSGAEWVIGNGNQRGSQDKKKRFGSLPHMGNRSRRPGSD